jgi:hypothetical protein
VCPSNTTGPQAIPEDGRTGPAGTEDLDLTSDGLADAPAHEEDPESSVRTGNS